MAGGSVDEDAGGGALVLERRGSWLIVAIAVIAVVGLLSAVLLAGSDDDDVPPTTTITPTATSDVADAATGQPALTRLPGADLLTEPIWLLAGRPNDRNTVTLARIDELGETTATAPGGSALVPGQVLRAIRADEAIVWSNGDELVRIDDELMLIPFILDRATAVHPLTDDEVWTVDSTNQIVVSPLRQDRPPEVLGPLPGELVAPLSEELFVLRFQGGVGLWIPGTEISYIGNGLLATTSELTVLSGRRDGRGALATAETSPFRVTATVPLDVEGIPLGDGALSPDGRQLAFHLQRGDRIELVVADLADGATTPLGIFTDRAAPVWLDDGRLVAIAAPTGERQLVWLVSPGTGEPSEPVIELDAGRAWTLAVPTR